MYWPNNGSINGYNGGVRGDVGIHSILYSAGGHGERFAHHTTLRHSSWSRGSRTLRLWSPSLPSAEAPMVTTAITNNAQTNSNLILRTPIAFQ